MDESKLMNQICPICGKPLGLDVEEHHIIPISYGGDPKGKTIFIHSNCHFATHKTAESILSKTVKNKNWFPSVSILERAAPYVQAIIRAKRNFQEGNTDRNKPRRHMIIVNLSDNEWKRLHKVKLDKGFTNLNQFFESILRGLTKF